ncbi:MAG: hypothetical protein ACXW13_00220 [Burkholderiaceae bacterium]
MSSVMTAGRDGGRTKRNAADRRATRLSSIFHEISGQQQRPEWLFSATMVASLITTDPPQKEATMNLVYRPTSLPLRSVLATCAVTITVAIAAFIDMLASDRSAMDAYAARPTSVMTSHG